MVYYWGALGETAMRGAFLTTPEEQIRDDVNAEQMRRIAFLKRLLGDVATAWGPTPWPTASRSSSFRKAGPGTRRRPSRSGIPGVLTGNTAEILLHRLSFSVLALKPAGFVTRVTL